MSEKVILPRDVAEAIERYVGNFNKEILVQAFCDKESQWSSEYSSLNNIELMTLMSALVNGYEVGTPEEVANRKVREYYDELKSARELSLYDHADNYQRLTSKMVAVRKTLKLLGITIEGINGDND